MKTSFRLSPSLIKQAGLIALAAWCLICASVPSAHAQSQQVTTATLQQLTAAYELFRSGGELQCVELQFKLDRKPRTLSCCPKSITSPDYANTRSQRLPAGGFFQCSFTDAGASSQDFITLMLTSKGGLRGLMRKGDIYSTFTPGTKLARGKGVRVNVKKLRKVKPTASRTGRCGTGEAEEQASAASLDEHEAHVFGLNPIDPPSPIDSLRRIRIATDVTCPFQDAKGGAQAANEYVLALINEVDEIYRRDLGLALEVVYQNNHECPRSPYAGVTDVNKLLAAFGNFARNDIRANGFQSHPHDVAHLFSIWKSGADGAAYPESLCRPRIKFAVSAERAAKRDHFSRIIAHMIGHNAGADHDPVSEEDNAPRFIMHSPAIESGAEFSSDSKDQIGTFVSLLNPTECLPKLESPSPIPEPPVKLPVIVDQPLDATVAAGQSVSFRVRAESPNDSPLSYLWETDQGTNAGTWVSTNVRTSIYTFVATTQVNKWLYRAKVTNSAGTVASDAARLTVTTAENQRPVFAQHPASTSVNANTSVSFTARAESPNNSPISYLWETNQGTDIWSSTGVTTATYTFLATTQVNQWKYRVKATNSAGATTSNAATLTVVTPPVSQPPVITQQPVSKSVNAGQSVSFLVRAESPGGSVLSYLWETDQGTGTWASTNVRTSIYTFVATNAVNQWKYRVKVTNAGGTVISNAVTLTVGLPAPTGVFTVRGGNVAAVEWNPVTGAAGYRIFRSEVSGNRGGQIATVPSGFGNSYLDQGLQFSPPGLKATVTYYYTVVAYDSNYVEGAPSQQVAAAP